MSNYYCKLYTQHHSKYEESIFDRIGGEFGFKFSKNQTADLSQLPSLFCDLTCKNLCTNETTEGLFSLHKNFIMSHEVKKIVITLLLPFSEWKLDFTYQSPWCFLFKTANNEPISQIQNNSHQRSSLLWTPFTRQKYLESLGIPPREILHSYWLWK